MPERYAVESLPTLLFFDGGRLVDELRGTVPETELVGKLESLLRKTDEG